MRSDQGLASVKAGTVVELVSRGEKAITIRYNGQVGTIPIDSVVEQASARTPGDAPASAAPAPAPAAPAPAPVTPAIILGPLTLFLANSPADSPDGLREYIPDGESVEHWLHMASIRVLKDQNDPQAYLRGVGAEAAKADPNPRHRSWPGDQHVLELITHSPATFSLKFEQWNLVRATHVEGKGLVVYKYAVRYFNYGDATAAKQNAERSSMLQPFESASFEELTNIVKPHNVVLHVVTDASADSFFPDGRFLYRPRVSMDFSGYMPDGLEIPVGTDPNGKVWCFASWDAILLDSMGTAAPKAPFGLQVNVNTPIVPLKVKGAFKVHTDRTISYGFQLGAGGTYTLVVDCFLKDAQGKEFTVSTSRNVTVVDTRAPDRSLDPAYRP